MKNHIGRFSSESNTNGKSVISNTTDRNYINESPHHHTRATPHLAHYYSSVNINNYPMQTIVEPFYTTFCLLAIKTQFSAEIVYIKHENIYICKQHCFTQWSQNVNQTINKRAISMTYCLP